jgi:hypothetical protein
MGALGQREEFCKGETGVGEMAQTAIGTGNNFLCPLVWTSASVSIHNVTKKPRITTRFTGIRFFGRQFNHLRIK